MVECVCGRVLLDKSSGCDISNRCVYVLCGDNASEKSVLVVSDIFGDAVVCQGNLCRRREGRVGCRVRWGDIFFIVTSFVRWNILG